MKPMHRILAFILVLVMVFADSGVVALAQGVLTMPEQLKIIDEEAFYGSSSIDKVTLPEGVTEIRSRAFANSTLSEINLPDSLTSIADDAFDGPEKVKVSANYNSTAYKWAVRNGYDPDIGWKQISNLDATVYGKDILLSWNMQMMADGYRIYEKNGNTNSLIGTASTNIYEIMDAETGLHTYIVEPYKTLGGKEVSGSKQQISVNVDEVLVESIILSQTTLSMGIGETETLTATVLPSNADNIQLKWETSDKNVATVTNGIVKAIDGGSAIITATAKDGSNVSATCIVEVDFEEPYLTVTHPIIGDVLSAGVIDMFNGEAYQTWTIDCNYPCRIETVGDWFYDKGLNTFEAGINTYKIYMDDGAEPGTKRTGKIKFYINDSLYVTVAIQQDGGQKEEIDVGTTISVNHPILGDIFEAGTFEMFNGPAYQTWTVTANCDWTITKSGTWFTVDRTSGSAGTSTIKLTMADGVGAGQTRPGSVTFKANGKTYKTVNFKQVGPEKSLTVTHALLGDIFDASPVQMFNGNAYQTWTVESNAAWTLKKSGTWFSVDTTSGNAGTTTVKLTFPDGADPGVIRNGTLSFYIDNTLYNTVKIYQDGGEEEIDTDPAYSISITHPLIGNVIDASPIMMHNGSATQTWTVNANFDWKITTTGATWFSVSPTSGSAGTTKVTITITDYTTSSNSGSIVFKKGSSKKATINIEQGGDISYEDSFSVSHPDLGDVLAQDTIYMFNGASYQTWTVMSNVDWSIDTYDDDWFTVSPTSGSANTASNQSTNVRLTFANGVAPGVTRTGRVRFTYYINGKRNRTNVYIAQYGGPGGGSTEVSNDPSLAVNHALMGDIFKACETAPIEMFNGLAEQNWTITSNTKWTIKTTGDWFSVSSTSGSANTENNPTTNLKITMSSGAPVGTKRDGSITFYLNGTKYRTVNFYQDGGQSVEPSMTLGSSDFGDLFALSTVPLKNEKRNYTWVLKSNANWSVNKSGDWFSITPVSGVASADSTTTLTLSVNALPAVGEIKTGSLTFKLNNAVFKTVTVQIDNRNGLVIEPVDTKLPAPTNVNVEFINETSAKITWNSVNGAKSYNVYRSTNANSNYIILNNSGITSPFIDTNTVEGIKYYYYITALSDNNSEGSGSIPFGPIGYIHWNSDITEKQRQFTDAFKPLHYNGTVNNLIVNESVSASYIIYNGTSKITSFLNNLGFDNVWTRDFSSGQHTVGYAIAHKNVMTENNEIVPLFAIIVRGTMPVAEEWISNFDVGTGSIHLGFNTASLRIWDTFQQYVKQYLPGGDDAYKSGRYKVWITGHSRGAAVGNLIARIVSNHVLATDMHTYLFATPNVTTSPNSGANIINFNIYGDFVPQVPLSGTNWNYGRNGTTKTLYHDTASQYGVFSIEDNDMRDILVCLQVLVPTANDYRTLTSGIISKLRKMENGSFSVNDIYEIYKVAKSVLEDEIGQVVIASKIATLQLDRNFIGKLSTLFQVQSTTHNMMNYQKWIQKAYPIK